MDEGKHFGEQFGIGQFSATERGDTFNPLEIPTVQWSASEFIDNQKSVFWFAVLLIVAALLGLVVYLMTNDWFGTIIVALLGLTFGLGAARRPRVLEYCLDKDGIHIAGKTFPYEMFKSYGVMNEGAIESIVLYPTKRWMTAINLYYSPEQADEIEQALGSFIAYEEHSPGLIDRFLHRIRF